MKIHDEIDDWTAGALCGVLTPDEQQNFERHLAECPHCRSLYEEDRKMNDILKQTLPDLRPDPNFERRVIAGFREKISQGWFHPLRGLVWLLQFRATQAALALLILAAMVEGGSLITGERFPGGAARKQGVDLLSSPTVMTKSGERAEVAVVNGLINRANINTAADGIFEDTPVAVASSNSKDDSRATGDVGVNFASTYYSRGILQGPQGKTGDASFTFSGAPVNSPILDNSIAVNNGSGTFSGLITNDPEYREYDYYPGDSFSKQGNFTITNGVTAGPTTVIAGSGTLNLTSAEAYSGATTVTGEDIYDGGRIDAAPATGKFGGFVNYGSQIKGPPTVDANGGTLSGTGIISGNVIETVVSGTSASKGGVRSLPMQQTAPALVDARKLIRNATLDFEVASFEKALDTITAVAGEEQGYVLTQNSEKGENGKLQGQIMVKVLPDNLDRFLLKLRALGDMKNQTVGGQDVTKDYYDTEARIRNSQITEARLVDMMKNRTGKVSDLLEVEKEIGRVRGEIEKMQGQLKYYDALVQYATVTITLEEKDINQTADYLLKEQAQLSLFAKDVDKAFAEAKSDAESAKALTLDSHIERDTDGRETATLHLLIPPEASDEAVAKLKAIGRIQNFNSQTQRVARDGTDASDTAKVDRDKVELNLVIQPDAENAVQGTNISVQTDQVEEKTAQIKQAAAAAGVEVKGAQFNRMQNGVEISGMLLRMPIKKYAAFLEQIKSLGKVKDFTVARREDSTATEDAPAEIILQIYSQGNIVPDENGFWATLRHTIGEGVAALMWSLRMIGVSLAFVAPWAVAGGIIVWLIVSRRRRKI